MAATAPKQNQRLLERPNNGSSMSSKITNNKSILHRLTRLARLVGGLVKQIWLLPWIIAAALRHKRRQAALDAAEAERLDRIRNPSDYLGK